MSMIVSFFPSYHLFIAVSFDQIFSSQYPILAYGVLKKRSYYYFPTNETYFIMFRYLINVYDYHTFESYFIIQICEPTAKYIQLICY